jgi:hypothetical protein
MRQAVRYVDLMRVIPALVATFHFFPGGTMKVMDTLVVPVAAALFTSSAIRVPPTDTCTAVSVAVLQDTVNITCTGSLADGSNSVF